MSGYEADNEDTISAAGVDGNDDDEVTSAYNPMPVSLNLQFSFQMLNTFRATVLMMCLSYGFVYSYFSRLSRT